MNQSQSLLLELMSVRQTKLEQIFKRIRKEEHERLFKQMRIELVKSYQQAQRRIFPSVLQLEWQQEVIQSILYFKNEGIGLDFEAINNYIVQFEGDFRQQFKNELVKVVFDHFTNNQYALASIANLLSKCKQCNALKSVNVCQRMQAIFQTNTNWERRELIGAKVLAYLLFQLLSHSQDKESFEFIKKYYHLIMVSLGYFDILPLLLMAEASNCRQLLPPRQIITLYLKSQINYQSITEIGIYKLCEFLQNYIRFDQSTETYQIFSQWIQERLKQRKFPLILKNRLITIVTMMLNGQNTSNIFYSDLQDLKIFSQIIYIAKFGTLDCKITALECLSTLVRVSDAKNLTGFIENYGLLEIIVYSFDLHLNEDLIFDLLTSLALILQSNRNCLKKASRLGVLKPIYKYATSSSIKIGKLAQIIMSMYQQVEG